MNRWRINDLFFSRLGTFNTIRLESSVHTRKKKKKGKNNSVIHVYILIIGPGVECKKRTPTPGRLHWEEIMPPSPSEYAQIDSR